MSRRWHGWQIENPLYQRGWLSWQAQFQGERRGQSCGRCALLQEGQEPVHSIQTRQATREAFRIALSLSPYTVPSQVRVCGTVVWSTSTTTRCSDLGYQWHL
eukprot:846193-Amphidinium_carterae.2